MKKITASVLSVCLTVAISGCGKAPQNPPSGGDQPKAVTEGSTVQTNAAVTAVPEAKILGREKFASVKVSRNASNTKDAEAFIKNFDGSVDVKLGPEDSNNHSDENKTCVSWIYHSPLDGVQRADGQAFPDTKQLTLDGDGVYLWTKTQHRNEPGFTVAAYYRTDGKEPFGSRGKAEDGTKVALFEYSHSSPSDQPETDSWWRVGPLPVPEGENSFTYKISVWKEK